MKKASSFVIIVIFFCLILSNQFVYSEPGCGTGQFLKLTSWNIRVFSNGSRDDDELRKICKIAKEFDFIAIQELRDETVLKRMIKMLKKEFSRIYDYDISPPVGQTRKEYYAFVYDPSFISPVGTGKIYDDDFFFRKPYYMSFKAVQFDFTVITTHIIWGSSVTQRRKEIKRLASVFRAIQDADLKENDVILLGDFNREHDDDLAWAPVKAIPGMIHVLRLPLKSVIHDSNLYDNIWFQSNYVKEYTLDKNVVCFDETDFGNDDKAASLAVSDHRPVWALFRIDFDDD